MCCGGGGSGGGTGEDRDGLSGVWRFQRGDADGGERALRRLPCAEGEGGAAADAADEVERAEEAIHRGDF